MPQQPMLARLNLHTASAQQRANHVRMQMQPGLSRPQLHDQIRRDVLGRALPQRRHVHQRHLVRQPAKAVLRVHVPNGARGQALREPDRLLRLVRALPQPGRVHEPKRHASALQMQLQQGLEGRQLHPGHRRVHTNAKQAHNAMLGPRPMHKHEGRL